MDDDALSEATGPEATGPGATGATSMSRRRFLVAGVAGVGAVGVVATGAVAARSLLGSPSGFSTLFGQRTAAVAALGRDVIATGVASSDPATLVAQLPDGIVLVDGRQAPIDVVDPVAFADGLTAAVAGDLAAGELVLVDGFPLTPTEAAVCAACALGPR